MSVVFINCTGETFTPANSGAIATWVYELSRAAEVDGRRPLVITRSSPHPQYDRPGTVYLDYPRLEWARVMRKFFHLQERFAGWQHPRHRKWFESIVGAIEKAGAANMPMVLSNDPELAVWLRQRFPKAFIFHNAHNNNTSPTWFRSRFGASVNVAAACSGFAARWNESYFALPAGKIQTLYNGVDVEAFMPRQGAGDSIPLINYVGKTDPIKGPDLLLKAAALLSKKTREFAIQIVGRKFYDRDCDDGYQRELAELAGQLRKDGIEVSFTGWISRPDLPRILGRAHINVTPSRWDEPFGLTTLEAMSCGMATIGSRTGGTPEVIGEAGLLFEREDVGGLANHLETFVCDRDLRVRYGAMARARSEDFSWRHVWNRMKEMIGL